MQHQKVRYRQWSQSKGFTVFGDEFHFHGVRVQLLHDGTYVTGDYTQFGMVAQKRDDIQDFDICGFVIHGVFT